MTRCATVCKEACDVYIDLKREYFDAVDATVHCIECLCNFADQLTDEVIPKEDALMLFAEGMLRYVGRYQQAEDEYVRLEPDIVLFDSFAYWGKLFAIEHQIRHISLITCQPFTPKAFHNHFDEILCTYCTAYPNKKAFLRMLALYEMYGNRRHKLKHSFCFSEMLCSLGEQNIVLFPRSMCRYAEYLDKSFVFEGPLLKENGLYGNTRRDCIYISIGTILQNSSFLCKCIDALLPLQYQIWVGAGAAERELRTRYLRNTQVHIYAFAPQCDILPRAAAFITHGGMNSVMEGILSQTPLFVVPMVNDEHMNAQVVEANGYGVYYRGMPQEITPQEIATGITRLISSQEIQQNLKEAAEQLHCHKSLERVSKLIRSRNVYGKI